MATSWTDRRGEYEQIARELSDVIRLTTKDGRTWRVAAWFLLILSFGRITRRHFLENFASTVGPIQAYPRQLPRLSLPLIAHESRHTRQFLFAGWFVPLLGWLGRRVRVWVGLLPMALIYGLFPIPVFLAWGRFRLELDAEAYAWRMSLARGWMTPDEVRTQAFRFAGLVSGWAYLKAWPAGWTRRACERAAEQITHEWESKAEDRPR
jgi:hypothetical protein